MSTPSPWAISQAIAGLLGARRRVLQDDPDLAADEGAMTDALGAAEEDVETLLAGAVRGVIVAEMQEKQAAAMADRLAGRAARYKRRAEALRGAVYSAMDVLGQKRVERPDFTVTVGRARDSLLVTDEAKIPDEYWRTERKLDTAALREDVLKNGVVVPGAESSNGAPTLTIRSK